MKDDSFYLVGDFNDWTPGLAEYRFAEVVSPYGRDENGRDHPDKTLRLGSFCLTCRLPRGRIQLKIVQGRDWERQWSVGQDEEPADFDTTEHTFTTRHGFSPRLIRFCGSGMPPHAEFDCPGSEMRFDFHPESQTLTIHQELRSLPGPSLQPWQDFACGPDAVYSTWVCLPFGYNPRRRFRHPVCVVFDGRDLLYGEDSWVRRRHNEPRRQFGRVFDILARQGVISPPVLVGVGVPRYPHRPTDRHRLGRRDRFRAYALPFSVLQEEYLVSICDTLLPALAREFGVTKSEQERYLLGHSNGGDVALRLLARRPDLFRGVMALSPGGAEAAVKALAALRSATRRQLRLALSYTADEPAPEFLTGTVGAGRLLGELDVPHLVVGCPGASHDPASMFDALFGMVAFVSG
jgi:hypothetical protein